MNTGERFLIDTSVLIEALHKYYPPEICPGFWDALGNETQNKRIHSVRQVKKELSNFDDHAGKWAAHDNQKDFFKKPDSKAVQDVYADLMQWVVHDGDFIPAAHAEFARGADGWLIAYAKANRYTLVTMETADPNSRKRVKIPDCCNKFGVESINTFEMLRRLGVRFRLL